MCEFKSNFNLTCLLYPEVKSQYDKIFVFIKINVYLLGITSLWQILKFKPFKFLKLLAYQDFHNVFLHILEIIEAHWLKIAGLNQ